MSYHGDIAINQSIRIKFTTTNSSGVPTTLSGTPAVAAYVDGSVTEITAGMTLTVDYDGRTGLNHVIVNATTGNGFTAGTDVQLVITAGTVDSNSVVGYVVGHFSIDNRNNGLTAAQVKSPILLQSTTIATLTSQTQFTLTAGSADNNAYNGCLIVITDATTATQKAWGYVLGYVGSTKTITLKESPGTFTIAATDKVDIIVPVIQTPNNFSDLRVDLGTGWVTAGTLVDDDDKVKTISENSLKAIFLDRLFAVDYDPASKPGVSTALLNELIESDGGVSRFSANTLEQAPDSVGGDATASSQTTIINHLTSMQGSTFNGTTDSLEAIRDNMLSNAGIADAVWDEALSGHTTAGSAGNTLSNSGGGGATASAIADAVWDEVLSGHTTSGSTGAALNASGSSGDPWSTALPGSYGAGTAGKMLSDIIADTNQLQADWVNGGRLDLLLDAVLADTNEMQGDLANNGRIDNLIDAIKAVTDNLPNSGSLSSLATATNLATVDTVVDAIKAKTDSLTFTDSGKLDATIQAVGDIKAAVANKIADHIIRRNLASVLSSSDGDTAQFRSLLGAIAKLVNKIAINGSNLEIMQTDDTTVLGTQATTTSTTANPITGLDTN